MTQDLIKLAEWHETQARLYGMEAESWIDHPVAEDDKRSAAFHTSAAQSIRAVVEAGQEALDTLESLPVEMFDSVIEYAVNNLRAALTPSEDDIEAALAARKLENLP